MKKTTRLRHLLARPQLLVVPCAYDALSARLVEAAGYEACFLSGAAVAASQLGMPDVGLLTLTEVATQARRMADGIEIPLLADADTGYGNAINAMRAVRELERAGAAGLMLEDQVTPKRCGHFEGKQVVPVEEMVEKLVAAVRARRDPALVLVARTDAIAVEGLEHALERARAYAAAGADVLYVEAPRTVEELAAVPPALPLPCLADMVEGGLTPLLPAADLERMGYRIALYANLALRAGAKAVERAFETLRRDGTSAALLDEILSWEERQGLVGLPDWQRLDRAIAAEAAAVRRP